MDILVGIDAGTSVIKAIAITPTGREQALATRELTTDHPRSQWAHQDMNTVWEQTAACLAELVEQLPPEATVLGVSIAGQGDGCWLIDGDGEPVRSAILWSDSRANEYVEQWRTNGTLEEIASICGSELFPGTVLPLLAWLSDERPQQLETAATLLFCKDWLTYKLTGERATDLSDGSLPLLDIHSQSYSDAVWKATGVSEHKHLRPELQTAGSVVGSITESATVETGLPAGTPVVMGLFDVAASAIGCGAVSEGDSVSSVGTSVVNQSLASTPRVDSTTIQVALWDGLYTEAIGSNVGTRSIEWVRDEIVNNCKTDYSDLEAAARSVSAGADGLVYLPYLSSTGERGPFVDPNARAQLLGLEPSHTTAHIVRAVYEGLALALRDCYEAVPNTVSQLYLTGGPTQSAFWNQLVADCMGVEIVIPDSAEPTALGAAVLAGVGAGCYSNAPAGVKQVRSNADRYHPTAARGETYDRLHEQYVGIRARMKEIWALQAETKSQITF
ncbi:FGGY-family carbohydrate kinase [Halalkalicoccus tibetensis]|uniref:FGGY family carbohydrate kinase n=1 Tax=Halalkalicoccus tibetensis TaxID=175632 RepID=A0ABD5V6D4_9EURY